MKLLLLIIILFITLLNYKKKEGFIIPKESLDEANKFLLTELKNVSDDKKQKIENAINYIHFIKTLF